MPGLASSSPPCSSGRSVFFVTPREKLQAADGVFSTGIFKIVCMIKVDKSKINAQKQRNERSKKIQS